MTASALTRPGERDRLIVKIGQIDWVFCFLVCAIAGVGGMMLFSIANAHWEPWAAKHLIRFGLCLVLMLGLCLIDQGDYAGAEALLRRALDIQRKSLGPDHPEVATSLNSLATLHHRRGDVATAESLYRQTLAIQERALGPDHPSVGYTLMNLGLLLSQRHDLAGAEPLYRRAIAIWEQRLGPDHPLVLQALGNLYIGETPREVLECDLRLEQEAVPDLKTAIALCEEVGDYVSRELFEDILESEEEHIDWLETQLGLIERLGEQAYLQSTLARGD